MKISKKLKALFFKDNQPIAMDLTATEIKDGKAFLHPKDDRYVPYLVKSDDIEVRLSICANQKHKSNLEIYKSTVPIILGTVLLVYSLSVIALYSL